MNNLFQKSLIFIVMASLLILPVNAQYKQGTCKNPNGGNYCDKKSEASDCYCDSACTRYGDCCMDYNEVCGGTGEEIKETVKCWFNGADLPKEECYSEKGSCKGTDKTSTLSCEVTVKGKKGEQVTWKSSCGGYAYTTIDGNDETITFECGKKECTSDSNCPQIQCVQAPCPVNKCVNGKCILTVYPVITDESMQIKKDDYFRLTPPYGNYKMINVQYKGADKIQSDNPVLRFKNMVNGFTLEQSYSDSKPLTTIKIEGVAYGVYIAPSANINQNDFNIQVDLNGDGIISTPTSQCGNGICEAGEDNTGGCPPGSPSDCLGGPGKSGSCPQDCAKVCPKVYKPVCGTDGNTYSNSCEAKNAGVGVQCQKECPCSSKLTKQEIKKWIKSNCAPINNLP